MLFPAFSLLGCLLACGLVLLGVWIGVRLRMPGGAMLLPLLLGLVASAQPAGATLVVTSSRDGLRGCAIVA